MTGDPQRAVDTAIVWQEFASRLRAFIAARVSAKADADDVLQTVFLHIHHRLPTLRSDTRLEAWLYRVTRNAIVDFYRARGAAPIPSDVVDDDRVGDEPPDEARRHELGRCLMPMLDELSTADREAIRMTDLEDATMAEAAQRLGLSIPGAKSRVQRARARLRKLFIDCCRVERDAAGRAVDMTRRNKPCCDPTGGET